MSFSVATLKTVAECDTVLAMAQEVKEDLDYKVITLTHDLEELSDSVAETSAKVVTKTAEMNAISTLLATLPDGKIKKEQEKKFKAAEYALYLLKSRQETGGAANQLERELDLDLVQRQLTSVADFTAAITAHKATL